LKTFPAFFQKYAAFIKISNIFEDCIRRIEAIPRIARLFKYNFIGMEVFKVRLFPQ
jgi:hypothetical protein